MLAANRSITTTQSGEAASTQVNEESLVKHLLEIARRHQVCYEVWPERSVSEGRAIRIGFELQLCGANCQMSDESGAHDVPGCEHCVSTYDELHQIAEWILPREYRPTRYEISGFDRSLHVAPKKRKSRSEVVLTIHILHRHNFNREVDDCEDLCLREMRGKLGQLGIREGIWRGENEAPAPTSTANAR